MTISTVRFFAGAAEAAGTTERQCDIDTQRNLADLVRTLGADDDNLAQVLSVCSFLLNGQRVEVDEPLPSEDFTLDVLPPFAGG